LWLLYLFLPYHDKRDKFPYALMLKVHKKKIKEIIGQINCPKDFRCVTADLDRLCQAMDIGMETYLQCLAKDSNACPFSAPFADAIFCKCPLCIYLKKKLHE